MVIQRMNNVLVKHSKVLFGIFTAVIIVSFVWFFTPGVDGSLLFGRNISDKTQYGTFREEPVTYGDLNRSMRILSIQNPRADIREEEAFFFAVQRLDAEKKGIVVTDRMLQDAIRKQFQKNGKFSPELYDSFETQQLAPRGLSKADFESALRELLRTELAAELVSANVTMTDEEFQDLLKEQLEKFSFSRIEFLPELLVGDVKYEEEDLKSFFEADKTKFLPPALCSGLTAFAMNKNFSSVTDDSVKAYFDAHKEDEFKGKDFAAVSAEIRGKLAAADGAAAKKVIQDFYKTMREQARTEEFGKDYETIFRNTAAAYKLEVAERNNIPAVEGMERTEALTVLKNPGSMTNPAFLTDRSQVSMLTAHREFTDTTFEEARERVKTAYCLEKAAELVPAAVEKFQKAVKESGNPAADLEKIVKDCKANLLKFPPDLRRIDNAFVIFEWQEPQLAAQLFRTRAGGFSVPVSSSAGNATVILYVSDRQPAADEEYKQYAEDPRTRNRLLEQKKRLAVREYQEWLIRNSRVTVPREKNAAPDSVR